MKNKWFVLAPIFVLGLFTALVASDGYSDDDEHEDRWRWRYEAAEHDDADEDHADEGHADEYVNALEDVSPQERRTSRAELRWMEPVTNTAFEEECGSCHLAFHPGLLPGRSWATMMGGLNDHFGENASLVSAARQEITAFLLANAADKGLTRRAASIARSIPEDVTPQRITETLFFKRKHDEISSEIWTREQVISKANCAACHGRAHMGLFDEDSVKIPARKGQ